MLDPQTRTARVRIVLRLGDEIGRDPPGPAGAGDDHDLGRPGVVDDPQFLRVTAEIAALVDWPLLARSVERGEETVSMIREAGGW